MPHLTRCISFLALSSLILVVLLSSSPASVASPSAPGQVPGTWLPAGSLADGRRQHTATLLSDGRVLVVGGRQGNTGAGSWLTSAEVYDPSDGTWSLTGSLDTGRAEHTATLLPDGNVLVTGGSYDASGLALDSSEIYHPLDGTWSPAMPLSAPRRGHTATRLADGRVLVAGGRFSTTSEDVHASAEIYDPVAGTWSTTGPMQTPREAHSATLLADGRVLVINGYYQSYLASAEIYDPAAGNWSPVPDPLTCHGVAHTATRLADGRVLVAGGACGSARNAAELYDPGASAWTATEALPAAREVHTATLLPDGRVLVAGGDDGDAPRYDSALVYHPGSGTWQAISSLVTGRRNHTATLLHDGSVLVVGGWGDETSYLQSTEAWWRNRVFLPFLAGSWQGASARQSHPALRCY